MLTDPSASASIPVSPYRSSRFDGWAPIHRACTPGRLDHGAVRAILRNHPEELQRTTPEGWTAPMLMAQTDLAGSVMLTWLIDQGTPSRWQTSQDHDGQTVLHHAARWGCANVVRTLLRKLPWAVDTDDHRGNTPLHLAARHGHTAVVDLLVDAGASPERLNQAGDSPRDEARCWGHEECVAALGDVRVDATTLMFDALSSLDGDETAITNQVQRALDLGARVNDEEEDIPALHHAAHNGHPGAVRLLLAAGANLHGLDEFNNTPLHLAMTSTCLPDHARHQAAVQLLLDAGANVRARNNQGVTPAMLARLALGQRPNLPGLAALAERCTRQEMQDARAELEAILPTASVVVEAFAPTARSRSRL